MDDATRTLLRTIGAACREIGSANSLQDRGGAEEARAMKERAARAIADALAAASSEDRERIDALFGADPRRRFDEIGWSTAEDYIDHLLARDPGLPVEELRGRQARFEARLEELRGAPFRASFCVRYVKPFSPSMLTPLLDLVRRNGDLPGWYGVGECLYHLNLSGEGLRDELREHEPGRYDALLEGVGIHVTLDPDAASTGVAVELAADDAEALARVERLAREALARHGWVEVQAPRP